jgi:hypothetical protein
MEHKSSMDEVERHYIGNILSEEQEPENEFSEALKQKGI